MYQQAQKPTILSIFQSDYEHGFVTPKGPHMMGGPDHVTVGTCFFLISHP